jgi:CHAD domain-containing protein
MNTSIDESFRFLAAGHFRKQAKQLARQLDGVRKGKDTECVHDARIASRRLRAALGMFGECFSPGTVKRWRKAIRRVTDALSTARDKDVHIESLCGLLANLKEKAYCRGVARLLAQLEHERLAAQPEVLKSMDRFEAGGVLEEMLHATKEMLLDAKGQKVVVRSPFVFHRTEERILGRLDELMRFEDSLSNPGDQERHHAMRIAAKRLRYTMELAKPAYDGRLKGSISAVKQLQTFLGDIHDCDVWLEYLREFKARERKRTVKCYGNAGPFAALQAGIDYLLKECRNRRNRVFRQLGDYWWELDRQGLWNDLVRTVQTTPAEGKPSRRACPARSDRARRASPAAKNR